MRHIRAFLVVAVLLVAGVLAQAQWTWGGTWSGLTAYTTNQVVYYNGSSYLCLVGNTGVAPPSNPTDWALIVQAGAAGAAGTPASISIGSTYAGPPLSYPDVTNVGSGSSAVLNFTIPQSWAVGNGVVSINGIAGAFIFNGGCFSQTGTTITFACSAIPFSALASATNTTAAMLVGTGASLAPTGTGSISANQINGVPLCNGFSPANGQNLQYTTTSTPNPCYTAASGSGGGAQTNCLVSSCIGGGTYASGGGPYTNGSSVAVIEQVTMAGPGVGATGCDYELSSTVAGFTGPTASIGNDSFGYNSVTFVVPAGATFSATVAKISGGGGCGAPSISTWLEATGS